MTRFCGTRYAGSIYLASSADKLANAVHKNLLELIVDPPIFVNNPEAQGISAQGQSFVQTGWAGDEPTYVAYDWIGRDYSPSDFVEEMLKQGLSNRIGVDPNNPKKFFNVMQQYRQAQALYYISPLAIIAPHCLPAFYENRILAFGQQCLPCKNIPEHLNATVDAPEMCASLWWEDIPHSREHNRALNKGPRTITRHGGDTEYIGAVPPHGLKVEHYLGIFVAVPMSVFQFEVINDPLEGRHEKLMNLLMQADFDIPFELKEE